MPRISIGGTRDLEITTNISGQHVEVTSGHVTVHSGLVDITNTPDVVATSGLIDINAGSIGAQVSGAVIVSGDVNASQTGVWGVQVSGAVIVSGDVNASVSGQPVDIVIPTSIITNATSNPQAVGSISGGVILTSADCISVTVKSLSSNSGDLYLGGYTAGQMPYSGAGLLLEAGEAINVDIDNVGKIHVYAVVSGDLVSYIANK